MKRIVLVAGLWWLVLAGVYLLLVSSSLSAAEAIAGGAVALLAAIALTAVRVHSGVSFELKAAWLKPVAPVPWQALRDSVLVLAAICRRPFQSRSTGRFTEREMNPGNDQPLSRTRRALVIASVSIAPNSIAIAIDRERRRLLLHELVPQPASSQDPDWPL